MSNPFDFVNAVTYTKEDVLAAAPERERDYVPFIVNRQLSYFRETLMYANEINQHGDLDNKLQFDFFLNSLRPSRRFAKWVKKEDSTDLEAVKLYYGYNHSKALQAVSLLSTEQITMIKNRLQQGGTNDCGQSNRSKTSK